jgi:predicted acylesterase/phospholipase RssA
MRNFYKLFVLFLLFSALSCAKPKEIDVSIVISGGVSLGAYQAGYNWATIRLLHAARNNSTTVRPHLRSVAGASAGSINALLTAMYWCQDESVPYKNSVDDNLFYDTWVDLGLEDLIIEGKDPTNKSTLFSRKKLQEKADKIVEHLNKPIYRSGCEIPLGISVTKVTPIIEEFQGIQIKNQNFSIPLTLQTDHAKANIYNKNMPPSTDFYLSIPEIDTKKEKVIDVLFASSAFPGAFQQVKLKYSYQGKQDSGYFIDGATFDNIPLQLSIELDKKSKYFIYMDPSNTRKQPKEQEKTEEKHPMGFFNANAIPLLDSLEIFQSMKLYQALHLYFKNSSSRVLVLSSRYHPLTGKFLEHFGAFLDKNFRIYDYYVGVYDGIYHLAETMKKNGYYSNLSQVELMDQFKKSLGIDENPEAMAAYNLFLETEFHFKSPKTKDKFSAIYNAFNIKKDDTTRYTIDEFKKFLTKLDSSYLEPAKKSFLSYAKRDIDQWYKLPLRTVIGRITTLENERAMVYPESTSVANVTSIAAWAGSTFVKEKDGFDILPLNAPKDKDKKALRTAMRLLPNEMATDVKNGGISLGYNAYWYKNLMVINGFEAKAAYSFNDGISDFVRVDLNTFKEYGDFVKFGAGFTVFGDMEGEFFDPDTAYGFNTYIDLIDIFRFTYVRRYGDPARNDYFYFGIENIPSLLYWLNR